MVTFDMAVLYVADVNKSVAFYQAAFGATATRVTEDFGMLAMNDGGRLAVWRNEAVAPAASIASGGSELSFTVTAADALDEVKSRWTSAGATLLQDTTEMDFGTSFTVADPDGHRLRAFIPARR